jgi:alkanesulfonate monooxygenase SsuD/methylene tetrahydromethanopterin reductase-like flavin-dependent oxidoreductase (luciferase family)
MSGPLHPFRFGVEMMEPFAGMSWAESARELEALGYSTLFAPDHFDEGLGPIAAMTAAASSPRSTCSPRGGSRSASAPATR